LPKVKDVAFVPTSPPCSASSIHYATEIDILTLGAAVCRSLPEVRDVAFVPTSPPCSASSNHYATETDILALGAAVCRRSEVWHLFQPLHRVPPPPSTMPPK
ncbi:hypothetical protein BHM03_00034160, partial [Ensete ventricosum]